MKENDAEISRLLGEPDSPKKEDALEHWEAENAAIKEALDPELLDNVRNLFPAPVEPEIVGETEEYAKALRRYETMSDEDLSIEWGVIKRKIDRAVDEGQRPTNEVLEQLRAMEDEIFHRGTRFGDEVEGFLKDTTEWKPTGLGLVSTADQDQMA